MALDQVQDVVWDDTEGPSVATRLCAGIQGAVEACAAAPGPTKAACVVIDDACALLEICEGDVGDAKRVVVRGWLARRLRGSAW